MPYKLEGNCVVKADTGETVKCHDNHADALAHLQALEANVGDAKHMKIGAMISKVNMSKLQGAHDALKELGVSCGDMAEGKSLTAAKMAGMMEMGGAEYAMHEGWDIQQCCSVISQLASMCQSECSEGEMDEAMALCRVMMQLMDHCRKECQDMMDAMMQPAKSAAVVKGKEEPKGELNLSYAKSIGVVQDARKLAVKFVAKDEIKGYTFLWGSPSLTDVEIEYFTNGTNFWDDRLGKSAKPLTWDHAQDQDFKASPIIGEIVDFGDDELGRWYVAKLDTSHKYRKAIDELIKRGVLGTSSDSAPQYVVREKTGKSTWLKEWPWFASALTNTPAEPRMIGSLEFLKSLGITLPDAREDRARYEVLKRQAQVLKIKNTVR